ncbi:MAG: trypsin-like peptidase domain-containing protein [Ruminococcus sp.]|nr:trypsin-like peptidase domain-containing protein [Ruminococcus sp.]
MIKLKKLIVLGLSSLTAMCFVGMSGIDCKINANASYKCDVNGDGKTTVADAVCVAQYLCGLYNIPNPEVADFNNDGFVSEADVTGIQYFDIGIKKPINADYTPSKSTELLNTNVDYYRYNATTGKKIGDKYTVKAATNIQSKGIIGNNDLFKDYTRSAICKIETNTGHGTGFVASDNSILTAGHVVKGQKIESITFYDSDGNETLKAHAVDYSLPTNSDTDYLTDYALITVSDDLSDYNNLNLGYALQYAVDKQADVIVTGWQASEESKIKDFTDYEMRTGKGRIDSNNTDDGTLYYTCDTLNGASGGPIYADLIFEGEHYYTVVGINTNSHINSNCGVRMCPNITNLVRSNLK